MKKSLTRLDKPTNSLNQAMQAIEKVKPTLSLPHVTDKPIPALSPNQASDKPKITPKKRVQINVSQTLLNDEKPKPEKISFMDSPDTSIIKADNKIKDLDKEEKPQYEEIKLGESILSDRDGHNSRRGQDMNTQLLNNSQSTARSLQNKKYWMGDYE